MEFFKVKITRQALRYVVTGLITNSIYYCVFLSSVYWFDLHHTTAISLAFPVSILVGYAINTKFTFSVDYYQFSSWVKYLIIYTFSFLINWFLLTLLIDLFLIQPWLSQLVGTAVVAVFNFLSLKYFVYRV